MTDNFSFSDVDVPQGAYIGWADVPGQVVTGKVLSFDLEGGTDFAGKVCPQLEVELIEPAYSVNKAGARTDFGAGEFVVITCGLANLKRNIRAADPHPGDVIKLTYSETASSANGTVKIFRTQIARGAAGQSERAATAPQAPAPVTAPQAPAPATAPQYTEEQIAAAKAAGIPLPGVA